MSKMKYLLEGVIPPPMKLLDTFDLRRQPRATVRCEVKRDDRDLVEFVSKEVKGDWYVVNRSVKHSGWEFVLKRKDK